MADTISTPHSIDAATIDAGRPAAPVAEPLIDELLVEEVSIDGMCGVY